MNLLSHIPIFDAPSFSLCICTRPIIGPRRRIQTLLLKAELEDPSAADERCAHSDEPIRIDGGTFAWAVDEAAVEAAAAATVAAAVTTKPLSDSGATKDAVAVTVPVTSSGASAAVPADAAAAESAAESASPSLIPSSPAILHDIDFSVRRGSLTAVVGSGTCGGQTAMGNASRHPHSWRIFSIISSCMFIEKKNSWSIIRTIFTMVFPKNVPTVF